MRRFDDAGKVPDLEVSDAARYRPLIERLFMQQPTSARWMRDACVCPECRDLSSGQHLLSARDPRGWTRVGHRTIRHDDGRVHDIRLADRETSGLTTHHWGEEHEVAAHPIGGGLDGVITDLTGFGIALASGLATAHGSVLEFAGRIGFVRSTNYGDLFDVVSVPEPNNLAYSSLGLPLHTDNPYRDPTPTVQILHCLSPATSGGLSRFSDGFAAAELLRDDHHDAFAVLTTTAVDFRFVDDTVHLHHRSPIISLGADGDIRAVRLNHRSMLAPEPPIAELFYDAYQRFCELIERRAIELRLTSGDVVLFDNRRVLHARTAFETSTKRHLQGCYVDIDAARSTARMNAAGG